MPSCIWRILLRVRRDFDEWLPLKGVDADLTLRRSYNASDVHVRELQQGSVQIWWSPAINPAEEQPKHISRYGF